MLINGRIQSNIKWYSCALCSRSLSSFFLPVFGQFNCCGGELCCRAYNTVPAFVSIAHHIWSAGFNHTQHSRAHAAAHKNGQFNNRNVCSAFAHISRINFDFVRRNSHFSMRSASLASNSNAGSAMIVKSLYCINKMVDDLMKHNQWIAFICRKCKQRNVRCGRRQSHKIYNVN